MKAFINSINVSTKKGIPKTPVASVEVVEGLGIKGDAHAGEGIKQVSLLAIEGIRRQKACTKAHGAELKAGAFAENITTEGIELASRKIGEKLVIGGGVVLEITKIGKECHNFCAIYKTTGDCIMPREGIFAKVLKGGVINVSDSIEVQGNV